MRLISIKKTIIFNDPFSKEIDLKINKVAIVSKFGSKKSEQAAEGIVEKLLKQKFKVYTVSPVLIDGAKTVNSLEDLREIKPVSYTHLTLPTKA